MSKYVYVIYGDNGSLHVNDASEPLAAFDSQAGAEQQAQQWSEQGHPEWGAFQQFKVVKLRVYHEPTADSPR